MIYSLLLYNKRLKISIFLLNNEFQSELSAKLPQIELEPQNGGGGGVNLDQLQSTREKLATLLGKVEEMREQRAQLVNRLQLSLKDDDPTQAIAATQNDVGTDPHAFFAKCLLKHGQLVQYIQQNLVAQENILRALTDANASYAVERQRLVEASRQRDDAIERLVASYRRVDELCEKARKGVAYFDALAREPLRELVRDVKEFCEWSKRQRASSTTKKPAPSVPQPPPRPSALVNPLLSLPDSFISLSS